MRHNGVTRARIEHEIETGRNAIHQYSSSCHNGCMCYSFRGLNLNPGVTNVES